MLRLTQLVVFVLFLGGCQRAEALSTFFQLTRTNLPIFRSIVIKVASDGVERKNFEVRFTAPPDLYVSDHIGGRLEIRSGEELIACVSVSGARPTAWPEGSRREGKRPIVFTFTVRREHLATSKFSISHDQPDSSRFDDYWFYLKDFADDPEPR